MSEAVSTFLTLALLLIVGSPILMAICVLGRCIEQNIIKRTDEMQDD